ncbi:oligosaccharide flippase family protein [Nocardioides houyundeii]|uniref:oligosaccharide flippase family protein n=1 Tax=Nocardioides houyundeii TaxID=2045452 RepID=UPI000C76184F|nr:oligosaccharide flippase family protein [Nocardioides houyundeii]
MIGSALPSSTGLSSATWILLGQVVKVGCLFVGFVALSRLLTPTDFGVFALALATVGIAELIRDAGLTPAAIQSQSLSQHRQNKVAWANALLGLTCTTIVALSAFPLAQLLGQALLGPVILGLSPVFFLNGMQAGAVVSLTRSFRAPTLAITDALAATIGLICALATAYLWENYWSLVVQQVTSAFALTALRLLAVKRLIPGNFDRSTSIYDIGTFGIKLGGAQMINYASSNIDSILIGGRIGAHVLGLYNRAFQLMTLPAQQIFGPLTNMSISYMAKTAGTEHFPVVVGRNLRRAGAIGSVVFGSLYACGPSGAIVAFGEPWTTTGTYLQILAIGGLFQSLNFVNYWTFLATGRSGDLLLYNLISKGLTLIAIAFASNYGAIQVAATVSLCLILSWPLALFFLRDTLNFANMFKEGLGPIVSTLIVGASGYLVLPFVGSAPPSVQLACALPVCLTAWVITAALSAGNRRDAREMFESFSRKQR